MLTVNIVNLIQISILSISILGILLLYPYQKYKQICLLLSLVAVASSFNLLEELNITREFHLITPVFVIGFGPAIYLAIKGLTVGKIENYEYFHLLPMLLALPFTYRPEIIIALATLWRIVYAVLSFKLILHFQKYISEQRSDAVELSLNWLFWSLLVMTIISALNIVRLNLQPYISSLANQIGQGISTFISLLFFILLIKQLIHQKDALHSLITSQSQPVNNDNDVTFKNTSSTPNNISLEDEAAYQNIFNQLSKEIVVNHWYRIPRLTLVQLSELSGFQVRDISRAINVSTQQNFNDYINQLRLTEVKEKLLSDSESSILSLAIEAGFNSKSSFNQLFKNSESMTPLAYRKEHLYKLTKSRC